MPSIPSVRRIGTALLLALACTLPAKSPAQSPLVLKLTIHDTIQPITAAYLKRGLSTAAARHASAVLISMGTPDGVAHGVKRRDDLFPYIDKARTPIQDRLDKQ
jgi:membrane-bound serine protease (ClpP class)